VIAGNAFCTAIEIAEFVLAGVRWCAMQDLLIRQAVASEQKDLEDLQLRASLTNAGDRDALLAHPDAIELPLAQITAGGVFVAEWDGTIVGFAAVEPRADGESELDALFVDPNMRRRGIARSLIGHCAEVARTRKSTTLCVIGNPHAKDFYTACGFNLTGTVETRFGTGLLMRMTV
jgi:GNAT superfamily N-acetyltransferase